MILGLWLAASPFVLGHETGALWLNDFVCGFTIVALAVLSFAEKLRHAHLGSGIVALWLIVYGFLASAPSPLASQNHILLGLVLAMFAIIPNEANLPPRSWRKVGT
jgi:hypothetical protein